MTYSNKDMEKPRKLRISEESDSNLIGPEDPERGNPPQHSEKEEQSECEPTTSEDADKDDN